MPAIPNLNLTHGQVLWILSGGANPTSKMGETVKYLRKKGVPFDKDELGTGRGNRIEYSFYHLAELSVALVLRDQGLDLQVIAEHLVHLRRRLRPIYKQAFCDQATGVGQKIMIECLDLTSSEEAEGKPILASGVWLDLGIKLRNDKWVFSSPKALGPWEMTQRLFKTGRSIHYRGFINLSDLLTRACVRAHEAPEIRPGR